MILTGIKGLFASKKGTLCLLILVSSVWALMTKHMDGVSFAAVVSSISSLFMWTTHKTEISAISNGLNKDGLTVAATPDVPEDPAMGSGNK
jgi:hypothetical protein